MRKEDIDSLKPQEIQIAQAVMDIFDALGIAQHEGNVETPFRIAKMFSQEVFSSVGKTPAELTERMTTFNNPQTRPNTIKIKNIKFKSMCEHHWLPFYGECDIEYIPENIILGLSKFPRVVEWFSKMPQVQERLTGQIGNYLVGILKPRYLKVVIRDTVHTCVTIRGVESECSTDTVFEYSNQE